MVLTMSPMPPRVTASGLMMARVRCRVFMSQLSWSLVVGFGWRLLALGFLPSPETSNSTGYWVLGTGNFLHRHRLPHQLDYRVANHRRRLGHADARGLEGTDLFRCRAMPAGNNGAGVAHAPSRRRGLPGDKRHHWLAHMRLDELGCRRLSIAADLANHDNGFRLRVALEKFQRVHEIRADDRVAANADGGGLPNAAPCELLYGFIGQRPRTRDDDDVAFLVNVSGHDADLALAGRDDARAVGPDQARAPVLQELPRAFHVEGGNALRDAHDKLNLGIGGFHDGVGGKRRRHKDDRSVGPSRIYRLLHCIEHRPAFVRASALARRHSANDLGAVLSAGLSVEIGRASW